MKNLYIENKTHPFSKFKVAAAAFFLVCAMVFLLPVEAANPVIRFKSPKADDLWIGEQVIDIELSGIDLETLKTVSVYLDGKLLKDLTAPPFRFNYDFGQVPLNRKLEVLVRPINGPILRKEILSYQLDDSQIVDVVQVVVPLVVTDRRGNYVPDLKKEDFEILEDGVPQEISYFSKSGKSNFHLVLLVDISASMRDKIGKVKEVAREFLRELMNRENRAIIVFFNHEVFEDNEFTSDINELDSALSVAYPFGATALYDAVAYSVKILKTIIGHNIIVLFSDGEDNSSAIDPYTLINMVERSNSVVYSIGKKQYQQGYDQYQDILNKISTSSGGMTFFLDSVEEVQKIYLNIRKDIQAKYLLRFSPKDKRRNRYRQITVKLKKRGLTVRTMKGYYY